MNTAIECVRSSEISECNVFGNNISNCAYSCFLDARVTLPRLVPHYPRVQTRNGRGVWGERKCDSPHHLDVCGTYGCDSHYTTQRQRCLHPPPFPRDGMSRKHPKTLQYITRSGNCHHRDVMVVRMGSESDPTVRMRAQRRGSEGRIQCCHHSDAVW